MGILFQHFFCNNSPTRSWRTHPEVFHRWIDHLEIVFVHFLANDSNDQRYESVPQNPTISNLAHPSNERQNPDNPYESRDRYTADARRTGGTGGATSSYESTRRSEEYRYTGSDRGNQQSDYSRRVVPTADVYVDPHRRPGHGNARTSTMEVNISVSLGGGGYGDRVPHASVTTSNGSSRTPAIRSTAFLEDVRYVDLNFRLPDNTGQLRTDGILRESSPRYTSDQSKKYTEQ